MPAPDNLSIIVPPCFYNFLVRGSGERGVVREGVGGRLRAPACSALTRHLPILPTHLYDFSAEEVGGGGVQRGRSRCTPSSITSPCRRPSGCASAAVARICTPVLRSPSLIQSSFFHRGVMRRTLPVRNYWMDTITRLSGFLPDHRGSSSPSLLEPILSLPLRVPDDRHHIPPAPHRCRLP